MTIGRAEQGQIEEPVLLSPAERRAWLIRLCRRSAPFYLSSMGLILITTVLGLVDPLIVRWLIDTILPQKDLALLIVAVGIIVGAYAARLSIHSAANTLSRHASESLAFGLRLSLIRRLLQKNHNDLSDTTLGELLSSIEQDVEQICELGGGVVLTVFRMVITLGAIVGVMLYLNSTLTVCLLPTLPMFLLVRRLFRMRLQRSAEITRKRDVAQRAWIHGMLVGITEIRLSAVERYMVRGYADRLRNALNQELETQRLELWFGVCSSLVISLGIAVVFVAGGIQVFLRSLSVGGLIAFYSYFFRLFDPVSNAVETTTRLQRVWASIDKVAALEKIQQEPRRSLGCTASAAPEVAVLACKNLWFSYRQEPILRGLTMRFEAGETVAIIGRNGSGKTSFIKVVAGLCGTDAGTVSYDDLDIAMVAPKTVRERVAVVQQNPTMFDLTIRDNILLGRQQRQESVLEDIIQTCELTALLERFDNDSHSSIGDAGKRISGGEAQRIAVARALFADKPILLLDEATSALDPATEAALLDRIKRRRINKITICVTHRIRSAEVADRVIVLEAGSVVLEGTHTSLLRDSSAYRRFWNDVRQNDKSGTDTLGSQIYVAQPWEQAGDL